MKKIHLCWKKSCLVLGMCLVLIGMFLTGYRPASVEAADVNTSARNEKINLSVCENNNEQIWYEDIDEAISVQVIEMEEKGESYEISDEILLDNGYYHEIKKEKGYSIVAGVKIDGRNCVITIDSEHEMQKAEIEKSIASVHIK